MKIFSRLGEIRAATCLFSLPGRCSVATLQPTTRNWWQRWDSRTTTAEKERATIPVSRLVIYKDLVEAVWRRPEIARHERLQHSWRNGWTRQQQDHDEVVNAS